MELGQIANRVLDEAASTNDLARRLGDAGFPHGTWVSARVQTAGRGRSGRRWESQEGNLFVSLVARQPETELWTWVPLATACASVSVLRALYPQLEVRIKWPNDLWVATRRETGASGFAKLGGILCEASSFVVIGLGLNCSQHPGAIAGAEVDQPTTSLSAALGRPISADEVRPEIIAELIHRLEELSNHGSGSTAADFAKWSALPAGTAIEWGPPGAPEPRSSGTVVGLGPSGELVVTVTDGQGPDGKAAAGKGAGGRAALYAEDVRIRPSIK